jgi:hypothetical protein
MVEMTMATVRSSNGQLVTSTKKVKELWMSKISLNACVRGLLKKQGGKCTLTGIKLQFRGDHEDEQLLPSLDRINSDKQYEDGNLQVVCRFINRWKSNTPDEEFRRLLSLVRGEGPEASTTNESEVIIEIGADGGSVTLYGIRTKRGWCFSRETIDCGLVLIDEGPTIQHNTDIVDSWEAALELLDQYPWVTLYPISIHPEFRYKLWVAVQERLQNKTKTSQLDAVRAEWDTLCGHLSS